MTLPTAALVAAAAGTVVLGALTVAAWSGGDGDASEQRVAVSVSGADLFRAKGCAACHDGPDSDSPFDQAPDLGELAQVAARRQPGLSAEDYVRRSITSPDSFTVAGFARDGMGSMPALALSADEVEALVQYLLTPDSG